MARKELWSDLHSIYLSTSPNNFIALGYFNVTLCPKKVSDSNFGWTNEIKEFKDAINKCCLVDLRYSGNFFTWSNRRYGKASYREKA